VTENDSPPRFTTKGTKHTKKNRRMVKGGKEEGRREQGDAPELPLFTFLFTFLFSPFAFLLFFLVYLVFLVVKNLIPRAGAR
jgi:hypothetical protein